MKDLIKSMFVSLLTGSCFMLGLWLIIYVIEESEPFEFERPTAWVNFPDELSIVNAGIVPDQDDFTVRGKVVNRGARHWEEVYVDLGVLAGPAQLNSCDTRVTEVLPDSTRQFEVDCYDTSGRDLPDNVSFTIKIRAGRHYVNP